MTQSTDTTYTIGPRQQLVDLNGDAVNFRILFQMKSADGKPFESVIIDQSTLDKQEHIEYRQVNDGHLSGEIVSDKNVYQNYFIALRSREPLDVQVHLDFERLPDYIEQTQVDTTKPQVPSDSPTSYFGLSQSSLVLLISVLALIAFLVYRSRQTEDRPEEPKSLLDKLKEANIT